MRPGGGGDEQDKHKQFEEEQQRQSKRMNLCAAGFSLDAEPPKHEARNLAAAKPVPQKVNRRERRHGGQGDQRERISEKWNHGSSKFQAPSSREAPNFKFQVWCLGFLWCLDVGAWNFILRGHE